MPRLEGERTEVNASKSSAPKSRAKRGKVVKQTLDKRGSDYNVKTSYKSETTPGAKQWKKAHQEKESGKTYNPFKKGSTDTYKKAAGDIAHSMLGAARGTVKSAASFPKNTIDYTYGGLTDPFIKPFHDGRVLDFDPEAAHRQFDRFSDLRDSFGAATAFAGSGGLVKKATGRFANKLPVELEGMMDDIVPQFTEMPPQYARPTGPIFSQNAPETAKVHTGLEQPAGHQTGDRVPLDIYKTMYGNQYM